MNKRQKLEHRLHRINTFLREEHEGLYDGYNKRGSGADINGIPCETLKYKELKRLLEAERDEIIRELETLQESSI